MERQTLAHCYQSVQSLFPNALVLALFIVPLRGDLRLAYRQFKWCQLVGTFLRDYSLMLSLPERTASGVRRCRQWH